MTEPPYPQQSDPDWYPRLLDADPVEQDTPQPAFDDPRDGEYLDQNGDAASDAGSWYTEADGYAQPEYAQPEYAQHQQWTQHPNQDPQPQYAGHAGHEHHDGYPGRQYADHGTHDGWAAAPHTAHPAQAQDQVLPEQAPQQYQPPIPAPREPQPAPTGDGPGWWTEPPPGHPRVPQPAPQAPAPQDWPAPLPAPTRPGLSAHQAWPASQTSPTGHGYPAAHGYPTGHGYPTAEGWSTEPGWEPVGAGRRRLRRGPIAIGVTTAVVLAAGGAFGYRALNGPGDVAEQHVPGSAAAVLTLDLDPGLGQKVDAVRFAAKFPGFRFGLRQADDDRKLAWELATASAKGTPSWTAVEDWAGPRAAIALLPGRGAEKPEPVGVVAVTDAAAARRVLVGGRGYGAAVDDAGWAYLARTSAIAAAALAEARKSPLTGHAAYAADRERAGGDGVVGGWFDANRLTAAATSYLDNRSDWAARIAESVGSGPSNQVHGAWAVHFRGTALELTGSVQGVTARSGGDTGVGSLPSTTLAAVGATGLGATVSQEWKQLTRDPQAARTVDSLAEALDLKLPRDLATLLGEATALGLWAPRDGMPTFGLRVRTGSTWRTPLRHLENLLPSGLLSVGDLPDGYTLSNQPGLPAALVRAASGEKGPDGKGTSLATDATFRAAVPDAAGACLVGYLDVPGLLRAYGRTLSAEDQRYLRPLDALGFTVRGAAGGVDVRLRLTTR